MELYQAIVLAVIQGVTELFPVSSLGHAVVLPHLFGWSIDQEGDTFLPFLVLLHVGTALALLIYFWRDWWLLLSSLIDRQNCPARNESRRLLLLLVIGTIPAGLIGLAFRHALEELFSEWRLVAVFLMLNGVMLTAGEFLRRRAGSATLANLKPWHAVGDRHQPGHCAAARLLALGRNAGRRSHGRPGAPGGGAVLVSAGDADHLRRGPDRSAEAAAAAGACVSGAGPAGGGHRRRDGVSQHVVPDALLQAAGGQRADPVRRVLRAAGRGDADLRLVAG